MAGVRRTWDKDYYEKKAKERSELGDDYVDKDEVGPAAKARKVMKEEFQQADSGAAGPMGSERAFLKARVGKLELDNKVGKTEVINPTSAGDYRGAGFWCEVCSCLLKDSSCYVDHINGKKHQRALGFSMRVERADVSSVKSRMEELKRKVANKSSSSSQPRVSALEAYNARLQSDMEAKESLKQRLKQQAEERKREKKETETAEKEAQEDEGGEEEDDEFKAMMGFSGFGTSKR